MGATGVGSNSQGNSARWAVVLHLVEEWGVKPGKLDAYQNIESAIMFMLFISLLSFSYYSTVVL